MTTPLINWAVDVWVEGVMGIPAMDNEPAVTMPFVLLLRFSETLPTVNPVSSIGTKFLATLFAAAMASVVAPAQAPVGSAGIGTTHQLPEGWKVYPMPSSKSDDWIHANHSSREWHVQAVDGKILIRRIAEAPQEDPKVEDDLPFKIKPRKEWGLNMAPPPPPPPPYASKAQVVKRTKATEKVKAGYFRSFAPRFVGHRTVAKAPDGWIVGFDAGEWGGGLYWFSSDGKQHYQIVLPHPVGWLDAENVRDILPDGNSFLVLQGLAHMSLDRGKVVRLSRHGKGKWTAELVADLGSAPCLCLKDGEGSWIIFTMEAMLRLRPNGSLETLGHFEFNGWLYPNSIARAGDGAIYVGMRHFVARVLPDGERYY